MNAKTTLAIAAAVVCLALPLSVRAQSAPQTTTTPEASQSAHTAAGAQEEARKMVPARAILKDTLDARKVKSGATFHASLVGKTQLLNGPLLPSGTILEGQIVDDQMAGNAPSQIAIRFTVARLKNGTTVPIKATIVDLQNSSGGDVSGHVVAPGEELPNNWTATSLKVDETGGANGVDLHSAIASPDSGVFVSSNKKDVLLKSGTELAIAVAQQSGQDTNAAAASTIQ